MYRSEEDARKLATAEKNRKSFCTKLVIFYVFVVIANAFQIASVSVTTIPWQKREIHYNSTSKTGTIEMNLIDARVVNDFCKHEPLQFFVSFENQAVQVNCHQWARLFTPTKLPNTEMRRRIHDMFVDKIHGCGNHPESRLEMVDCNILKKANLSSLLTALLANLGVFMQSTASVVFIWFIIAKTATALYVSAGIGLGGCLVCVTGNLLYVGMLKDITTVFTVNNLMQGAKYTDDTSISGGYFFNLVMVLIGMAGWIMVVTPLMFSRHIQRGDKDGGGETENTRLL
eukprot:Platyproteum_vivax@DN2571_c0_g1_i1.p1